MLDSAADSVPPPTADLLAVLDFGLFEVNAEHGGGRTIGIPGYLIRSGRAVVLVDGGFPRRYLTEPAAAAADDGLGAFGRLLELTPEQRPEAQLERLGVEPAEVTHAVLTHGDVDHVGLLEDFAARWPNATLVVGAAERALPRPRYFGDARPLTWPVGVPERRIEEDTELVPGVELLVTPGHAPGHLSLLVRLAESGPVLLTADAISRPAELDEGFGGAWDAEAAAASAARLIALAADAGALVLYGHDPEQWSELRRAPEVFR